MCEALDSVSVTTSAPLHTHTHSLTHTYMEVKQVKYTLRKTSLGRTRLTALKGHTAISGAFTDSCIF